MLARDVYNLSVEEIWALPEGPLRLEFEDGVLETTSADTPERQREFVRETRFSWYCAEYHRQYPKTPCRLHHHMDGERFGKGTHLKLLGNALFDCFDAYEQTIDIEVLSQLAYMITNWIYNDFSERCKAYVTSLSALDFLEILDDPDIAAANASVTPSQLAIEHTYSTIKRSLKSEHLAHNPISKVANANPKTIGQIVQCVGPRGFLTEIEGTFFRHPIIPGFMTGLRSLHDSMIESRSASKALLYAKDPVAESEYFNRKLQLGTVTLANLHIADCGTTETIPFMIRAKDLEILNGKYFMTDEGIKRIDSKDRSLINKLVRLRSPLRCLHPDPYGVCSTCFGELSHSVPKGTNIGHLCTTVLCEEISQNILSTKHLDSSATSSGIHIDEHDRQYIREGSDGSTIRLSERLEGKSVHITLPAAESPLLANVAYIENIRQLPLVHFTELTEVQLTFDMGTPKEHSVVLAVSKGSLMSSLTYDALNHIRDKGWKLTSNQNYRVDMSDWDVEMPLFQLPMKHTSMVDYGKSIEACFKSTKSTTKGKKGAGKSLRDYDTAEEALVGFYTLVSEKLSVNMAHLEVIVASAMICDERTYDHRIPTPPAAGHVGSYTDNMQMRSLSATMAFEKHDQSLFDVRSFTVRNRPAHPMDELLVPHPMGIQREYPKT